VLLIAIQDELEWADRRDRMGQYHSRATRFGSAAAGKREQQRAEKNNHSSFHHARSPAPTLLTVVKLFRSLAGQQTAERW
jgi:hypothetical protein